MQAQAAEAQQPTVAVGVSDFAQLAAVVGEPVNPTVISIATPRGRTPVRDTTRTRRETNNTIRGALATMAAAKRAPPENVDSDAPKTRKVVRKTARTQNNFSRELTADEMLDFMLKQKDAKTIVLPNKEPEVKGTTKGKVRKATKQDKKAEKSKETPKTITDGKVSNPDKLAIGNGPSTTNAPKMSQATTEEKVISPKEMQFWQDLEAHQIVKQIVEEFPRHKNQDKLETMRKATLLKYVMRLVENRNKVGTRNRTPRVK